MEAQQEYVEKKLALKPKDPKEEKPKKSKTKFRERRILLEMAEISCHICRRFEVDGIVSLEFIPNSIFENLIIYI